MKRLADLVQDRKEHSLESFLTTFPDPVLLHRPEDSGEESARSFKTGLTDPHATRMELAVGLSTDADLAVVPVSKAPDGVFSDRVGVGRTRNNDIVLPYPKVSKFHAYFTWSRDRSEFYLTDAGSTNGTFVNGHRLKKSESVIVPDRCVVSFGRYHFRFHTPKGLYETLGQIAYGH
ncbi:MAG: FHA domain-containing protein [Deltaproteobacteria bacterium]|nr:FHA domain-containing protein [Deltaproteobacteria bacterium]